MQLNSLIAKAAAETARTVRGVQPDQHGAPTPCPDWDVRTLVNHLLQVASALNLAGRGEPVPEETWRADLLSGDWAERFEDETRQAVAAWAHPAAPERTVTMGSFPMPAPLAASMLTSDLVIHGWDLAKATRQDYHCDDAVAELTHRFITDMGEQGRGMGLYGAPVPVADQAPILDRALGLSGRNPHWTPSAAGPHRAE